MTPIPAPAAEHRCGVVAILGAPNAGKSTLMNVLVGSKVSIVTPKVQTTRTRIIGIGVSGDVQLVFIDTPGIIKPKRRLDRAMVAAAWRSAEDVDAVVLMVDAAKPLDDGTNRIIEGLQSRSSPVVAALNKIDLVNKDRLLENAAELNRRCAFARTFMISALSGDGVSDLKDHLSDIAPSGPWLYPEDQVADLPLRLLAAETTREKLFLMLKQELPYATTVEPESWRELADGSVRIEQVIYVLRDTQKAIVLGKGGAMIKEIGGRARRELEKTLEQRVHLMLRVKVRANWLDEPERYRVMGLEFPR